MFANITWPSLYIYNREHVWWIILMAIIVEFAILRWSLKTNLLRALGITLAINLFSALIGMIPFMPWTGDFPYGHSKRLPPLIWVGLMWGVHVDGTFSAQTWLVSILCAFALSTLFESLLLFTVFRRVTTKWCMVWLPAANLASAGLTYLSLRLYWA